MSSAHKTKLGYIVHKIIPNILQWVGAITVSCFILLGIVFLNRFFFLTKLNDFLVLDQQVTKSDVIIVLSGGNQNKRVLHGVNLLKQGYGDTLLMTGGPGGPLRKSCPEIMLKQAVLLGINANSIFLEEEATTTLENAKYSLAIMKEKGYRSAIVVTSAVHTRRSNIIFEQFFDESGISFVTSGAPATFYADRWWEDDLKVQTVAVEYMKLIWYYFFQGK